MNLGNPASPCPEEPTPEEPTPDGPALDDPAPEDGGPQPPATDKTKMAIAAVLLITPIVVLMAVPHYARVEPTLLGFPFFFWYQFVWVVLCSMATYVAYRLTLAARRAPAGPRSGPEEATHSTTQAGEGR